MWNGRRMLRLMVGPVLTLVAAASAPAQVGEFGRNKAITEMEHWHFVQTPHFDIYFYSGMDTIARVATSIVEDAYSQISASFDYRLRNRIPIMLYRSHQGFSETQVTPELVPEGVGGFTEFLKNRVAVPFEGSYPLFRHVLHHELTHAVMHDMLYGRDIVTGVQESDVPLWFTEGLAEYESIPWTAEADMWMRDAVVNDYLQLDGYFAYKGGQSILYYIAEVYGPDKVAQILHRLRGFSRFNPTMQAVLGVRMEDFAKKWEKDLKKVYWPEIVDRDEPDDVGPGLTDHKKDNSYFNRNPVFSPYGDKIAFLTGRDYYTSIYVMSAIDGKILWKVVAGERSGAFEEMHWEHGSIAWSPDAKRIAFAAKSTSGDRLYIVDAQSGKRRATYNFHLDGIYAPDWSPDGTTMAFIGLKNGRSDIYLLNLATKDVTRLTDDMFEDTDPKWSPDGTKLVFSSDRLPGLTDSDAQLLYRTRDVYVMDVATRRLRRLTNNPADETSPTWAPDGKSIAFVSDVNGIFNIYVATVDNSDSTVQSSVRPLTNLLTGAFSPSWSPTGDKIAFSAFNQGGWDIHVIRDPLQKLKTTALRPAFYLREGRLSYSGVHRSGEPDSLSASSVRGSSDPDSTAAAGSAYGTRLAALDSLGNYSIGPRMYALQPTLNLVQHPDIDSARGGFIPRRYSAHLGVDDVQGYANYSTLGGVGGLLTVTASDLLGYHQLAFSTSLYRDLRDSDYSLFYQYLRRRTSYAVYFDQVRTWYPFEGMDQFGNIVRDFVERRDLDFGMFASRPTSQFRRFEFGVEYMRNRLSAPSLANDRKLSTFLTNAAFVHDNALWNQFGPMLGSRWRLTLFSAPPQVNSAPFGVATVDWRRYVRVTATTSFAFRTSGGMSFAGKKANAPAFYLGGLPYWINYGFASIDANTLVNDAFSQFVFPLRGASYYELVGRRYAIVNAEYRFPLIRFLATGGPLAVVFSNIGGVLFFDMGKVWDIPQGMENTSVRNNMVGGYGYGVRFNLGVLVLRIDAAWKTDLHATYGGARYYWSFGYDF